MKLLELYEDVKIGGSYFGEPIFFVSLEGELYCNVEEPKFQMFFRSFSSVGEFPRDRYFAEEEGGIRVLKFR